MTERQECAARIAEAKAQPCADGRWCAPGPLPSYMMQFDHVRGEKYFNVTRVLWGKTAKARIDSPSQPVLSQYEGIVRAIEEAGSLVAAVEAEIAKCDVVCANCHAHRSWGSKRRV